MDIVNELNLKTKIYTLKKNTINTNRSYIIKIADYSNYR